MRSFQAARSAIVITATFLSLLGQAPPAKDALSDVKGLPPRATAGDYQAQAQAGTVTIGAEFTGHSLPTSGGPLTNEDYIGIETGVFGPPDAKFKLSADDFSLRLNGKKVLPSQRYGVLLSSLKDPEWQPPEPPAPKSKTSLAGGGQGQGQGESSGPPPPVKIPIPVQRAMAQRLQKASLPEGERALPQAGLIYFQHRGKTENLQSVELIYDGPAGKAVLKLQP